MNYSTRTSIVTGITGMDGALLSEYLLSLGYTVVGVAQSGAFEKDQFLQNLKRKYGDRYIIAVGDIRDSTFVNDLYVKYQPYSAFGLAALSNVGSSFKNPVITMDVNATAVVLQLEAIRLHSPHTKYYNAATSELYGNTPVPEAGYNEASPFAPRSIYGVSKLAAFYAVKHYRERGIFAVNGILFNHSAMTHGRRSPSFFSRKITRGCAAIKLGLESKIKLGTLDFARDEGSAEMYVIGQHMMLEHSEPSDWVLSTGITATGKEMLDYVCELAGLKASDVYFQDPEFIRPTEVSRLLGDSSKIRTALGWNHKYDWRDVLRSMYHYDLADLSSQMMIDEMRKTKEQ